MGSSQWVRVKEVFHAVLDSPPERRSARLDDLCGGDAALRVEVARLLAAHARAGDFIEGPPAVAPSDAGPRMPSMTGRILGHYEVGRLIGAGGMGEVYEARDVELGRLVALKVVSGQDAQAQLRLRQEAQHASCLNHPHICTIHEVGAHEGLAYIVMEFVEGQPLSELIPLEGLPTETVLRYGVQIADALAHAHQHDVVHRDLKSANVVVTSDGRAKVLDFGLARRLPAKDLHDISRSVASTVPVPQRFVEGTLTYMAPEVLRGGAADARSDIWALGVVLFEMTDGRRPFTGGTGFEVSAAIMHEAPPPLAGHVPAALQAIVRRSLAKEPRERYQHSGEVRSALEAVQSERSGINAGPSGTARSPIFRPWALAALAFAVLIVALAFTWRWIRPGNEAVAIGASGRPAIAVMSFKNVSGGPELAWLSQGVPSMLLTGLAQTRGLDLVSPQRLQEAVTQAGRKDLASLDGSQIAEVARSAGAGAVVVGNIFKLESEIRIDAHVEDLSSGRILTAESVRGTDLFAMTDQLASRILDGVGVRAETGARSVADVSTGSLEAYRLYSQGSEAFSNARATDAETLLRKAVAIDPAFAQAYLQLSSVSNFFGRPGEGADYSRKAAEHADRLTERERLLLQVRMARDAGHYAEAVRLDDELLARFGDIEPAYILASRLADPLVGAIYDPEKVVATISRGVKTLPSSVVLRNLYGYALIDAGRYTEAVREFETYARMAPREANPYDSLGETYLAMGLPEKAVEYYSRALTVDPNFSGSRNGRAWAWAMQGRYDEAIADDPPNFFVKAFILSRVGRYAEAEQAMAAGRRQAGVDKNFADLGAFYLMSSLFAVERGDYPRARQESRSAEQAFARQPDETKRIYLVLGHLMSGLAHVRTGDLDAARTDLESQTALYRPAFGAENWWHQALAGDIALAAGHLTEAAAAYSMGEPIGRMFFELNRGTSGSIFANNLISRDGPARVKKAGGDLEGAIQIYRRLTTPGADQKWVAMLEPRYILELARLLNRAGEKVAARREYQRFADLWKRADPNLPELEEVRRALSLG